MVHTCGARVSIDHRSSPLDRPVYYAPFLSQSIAKCAYMFLIMHNIISKIQEIILLLVIYSAMHSMYIFNIYDLQYSSI